MARWLKQGAEAAKVADQDRKVREIVEQTLADIEKRGDAAVRELSIKFDGWDRDDYRLTTSRDRRLPGPAFEARHRGHRVRAGAGPQFRAKSSATH